MSRDRIKAVLVGCGGMAKKWASVAVEAETIELVGLVDLDRSAAEAMAERCGLPREAVFGSLASAVKATSPDAVFDVTVPKAHAAVTTEALGLGCHVLGEKPMAESIEDAKAMVAAAERAGRVYAVTQTRRPVGGSVALASFVADGGVGDLAEAHSDFFLGAHFDGFRAEMDHPLLGDMAIHTFDTARQVTGRDPLAVTCVSWNPAHSWYRGDASATAVFEMTDGVVYTYRGSWCADGQNTEWIGSWRLVGSAGGVAWDGKGPPVAHRVKPDAEPAFVAEVDAVEVPVTPIERDGHTYLIHEFADHLLAGRSGPLSCPCEDNLLTMAMVVAAIRSADEGRRVEIAELLG